MRIATWRNLRENFRPHKIVPFAKNPPETQTLSDQGAIQGAIIGTGISNTLVEQFGPTGTLDQRNHLQHGGILRATTAATGDR